jgi:hypothetical protein
MWLGFVTSLYARNAVEFSEVPGGGPWEHQHKGANATEQSDQALIGQVVEGEEATLQLDRNRSIRAVVATFLPPRLYVRHAESVDRFKLFLA